MNFVRRLATATASGGDAAQIAADGTHVEFGAIWKPTANSNASWSMGPVDISWKVDTSSNGGDGGGGGGGFLSSSTIFTGTAITAGAASIIATLAFCL